MVFNCQKDDWTRAEIKKVALAVLRSYCECHKHGEIDLDDPMWALADLRPYKERVRAACPWFRVAVQSGEDEEGRRMLCQEVYGWIEWAMR
jgi:hypothetical protein